MHRSTTPTAGGIYRSWLDLFLLNGDKGEPILPSLFTISSGILIKPLNYYQVPYSLKHDTSIMTRDF